VILFLKVVISQEQWRIVKFKYLQHTADAKFRAFGETIEEAFGNAALAMVSLMWDPEKIEPEFEFELCVFGRDEKQLLVNFLEDILFKLDTKMFLLKSVEKICFVKKNNQLTLKAVLSGDTFSEKYETFGEVKAITYNEMEIVKNHSIMVQVVVDM
jgi:SHS2 domain-containing protein